MELVEEPYTQRDVRVHVQRLRDLLVTDLIHHGGGVSAPGSEGLTLSFLSAIAMTSPDGEWCRVGGCVGGGGVQVLMVYWL